MSQVLKTFVDHCNLDKETIKSLLHVSKETKKMISIEGMIKADYWRFLICEKDPKKTIDGIVKNDEFVFFTKPNLTYWILNNKELFKIYFRDIVFLSLATDFDGISCGKKKFVDMKYIIRMKYLKKEFGDDFKKLYIIRALIFFMKKYVPDDFSPKTKTEKKVKYLIEYFAYRLDPKIKIKSGEKVCHGRALKQFFLRKM